MQIAAAKCSPDELHARSQPQCFVCGQDNARGLRIAFHERSGRIEADWLPGPECEGFFGIIHGGVVSSVLDEAMSKAVAVTGTEALTAELRVRFRRAVASGHAFRVRGWIVTRSRRVIRTEALLMDSDGTEHAHAWASFLPVGM